MMNSRMLKQIFQKHRIFVAVLILFSVSFKFIHIDSRYFWYDEICTIRHTSGLNQEQIYKQIPVNQITNIEAYRRLWQLNDLDLSIGSELKGLYTSTNLNPLHYTILIFWYRMFGDSQFSFRLFSLCIFILALPFLFLFVKKIFKSELAGWIAVGIFCASPFFHFFALEARYYILWTFLIILLNYQLLIIIAENKTLWWISYTITGILSLYASTLSGLVIIGHAIYIIIFYKEHVRTFLLIGLLIFIAYLPWLITIIIRRQEVYVALSWHNFDRDYNIFEHFMHLLMLGANSFTVLKGFRISIDDHFNLAVVIAFSMLIVYSIIFTIKKSSKDTYWFLLLLILPQMLFFIVSDLFRDTATTLIPKYHVLLYMGFLFFLVFLLSEKVENGKILFFGIYLLIIFTGLFSVQQHSQDKCWEVPLFCQVSSKEAQLFSSAQKTCIITDYSMPLNTGLDGFWSIVKECTSNNIDILKADTDIVDIKKTLSVGNYSEIYVAHASIDLVSQLKVSFGSKMDSLELDGVSQIWRIKNISND